MLLGPNRVMRGISCVLGARTVSSASPVVMGTFQSSWPTCVCKPYSQSLQDLLKAH